MAGIFFEGGVSCSLTVNAQCNVRTVGDCPPLYYGPRCNVGVNPLQMNAVISELANAINLVKDYDCNSLTNLSEVLQRIKNLCNQPALAVELDGSDRIAGCFDGQSGTIILQQLVDYIVGGLSAICDLPAVADNAVNRDNVLIGACVAGEEQGLTGRQVGNLAIGGKGYRYYNMRTKRATNTWYQNNSEMGIEINVTCNDDSSLLYSHVGPDQEVVVINVMQANGMPLTAMIPPGDWYRVATGSALIVWTELRPIGTEA